MTQRVEIIGFEGGARDLNELTVSYGAAALRKGDRLINAVTRSVSSMDRWPNLVKDGNVAELPEPVEVPDELLGKPMYVMICKTEFAGLIINYAQAQLGPVWTFLAWPDVIGIIFPSLEKLKKVGEATSKHIRETIFGSGGVIDDDANKRWRTCSQILDPWDGLGQEEFVKQLKARRLSVTSGA